MTGQAGIRVRARFMPHHDHRIEVYHAATGRSLGPADLADQATEEQVSAVRRARAARSHRLKRDLEATHDHAAATLALHDRARYTDGCAAHPVPPWAGIFLRAAACLTRFLSGEDQELLAAPGDRGHLLHVAETTRLRPPQPPAARRKGPAGAGGRRARGGRW
jgi:hypothetical protein